MPSAGPRPSVLFLLDWQPVPWSTREEFFARTCAALAARGIVPILTIPKIYAPEIQSRMQAAGAVVAVQSFAKGPAAYRDYVRTMARTYDVRLAHIRFFTLDSPVAWYCRLAGIRTVFYTEANGGEWRHGGLKGWAMRTRVRVLSAPITCALAISEFVRARLLSQGMPSSKVGVVYNGVDLATFRPDATARAEVRRALGLGDGAVAMLFASKPLPIKRPRVAVATLAALVARGVDAHLWMAGIGTMQAELSAEAERLGVAARIRWLGHVADIARYMAAADVLLHTTQGEAFGNVFVEAMASALPIVATRSGAAPEVIPEGRAGLLIEAGDGEVERLADGVAQAMRPDVRAAMGAAGVEAARAFTLERCVDATLAEYAPYLSPPTARP
ncbi:MAG: glycosyltransferase family 4 protein [Gemmatimonadetes bacterium]|nr:glycosyltransferase family 4 protein [Gemmatimonadota bacterium]